MVTESSLFVGVDVGGTKIHAALVKVSGQVERRVRVATPRGATADEILDTVRVAVEQLLGKAGRKTVGAVGLAVPGLVEFGFNRIAASPNIAISGLDLVTPLKKAFSVPCVLGNDTDAATLGEQWMGSARGAQTAVGMFIGTGIGGGIVVNQRLVTSPRTSVAEIGHMIIDRAGPVCGCGNVGCLEALASRTAIERDLRAAIAAGRKTVLAELLDDPNGRIRSGMLAKALAAGDKLVGETLTAAARAVGTACVNIRHLLEPDVMILGGGVMEACGEAFLATVREVIAADLYFGRRPGGRVVESALADDAGILGAAAMAMQHVGVDPFDAERRPAPRYPELAWADGGIVAGKKRFTHDLAVRVSGKARRRDKADDASLLRSADELTVDDLRRACQGGPETLLIGVRGETDRPLTAPAADFLDRRAIGHEILPVKSAVKKFNGLTGRKAAILLLGRET